VSPRTTRTPHAGASVRCLTKVTTRIITHEQLVEYLIKQPMAKHQIRWVRWRGPLWGL